MNVVEEQSKCEMRNGSQIWCEMKVLSDAKWKCISIITPTTSSLLALGKRMYKYKGLKTLQQYIGKVHLKPQTDNIPNKTSIYDHDLFSNLSSSSLVSFNHVFWRSSNYSGQFHPLGSILSAHPPPQSIWLLPSPSCFIICTIFLFSLFIFMYLFIFI